LSIKFTFYRAKQAIVYKNRLTNDELRKKSSKMHIKLNKKEKNFKIHLRDYEAKIYRISIKISDENQK